MDQNLSMDRYTLTLKHEYVMENGKTLLAEEPVSCEVNICDTSSSYNPHCVNEVIDHLLKRMRTFLLRGGRHE